jgi:hypothetical protein
MNYACWFHIHELSTKDIHPNTIMESINVVFFEVCFLLRKHNKFILLKK